MKLKYILFIGIFLFGLFPYAKKCSAQARDFQAISATVDFNKVLHEWDGFGVNYVECAQTFDYKKYPQDYGGFDVLSDKDKQTITEMVFGDDGLQPNIIKMFLDPLHQKKQGGEYDHETTTKSMRYFAKSGYQLAKERGDDLSIVTTLYGPPAYITKQKILRGRDLDPTHQEDLCYYMIDWARFLKENEGLPVNYISIHNEGESWLRWPQNGTLGSAAVDGHDYNFFWNPSQMSNIINLSATIIKKEGLKDLQMTNGEPTNWYRFSFWGFADELADNKRTLNNLGIVTSHGFYVGEQAGTRWFGPHSSSGIDQIREIKPEMKAWCTSTSWDSKDQQNIENGELKRRFIMDAGFVKEIHGNIYEAKVNAVIPWAFIQKASHWHKPDPNPGSAFRVYDDGTWEVKKGYYYFKQVTRAGKKGMNVVRTSSMDSEIALIGFEKNKTQNRNAVVLINYGNSNRYVSLKVKGAKYKMVEAFRTCGQEIYQEYETAKKNNLGDTENYESIKAFSTEENTIKYEAPGNSVTTFFLN